MLMRKYYYCCCLAVFFFFFFKQKTAYEMRISDWSSDVCSSDLTSAYGVDTRHDPREWKGREVRAHMTDLARELGQLRTSEGRAPWVRLHYVYPYPHVDAVIPLMADGLLTPYLDIPFQHASQIGRASCRERVCQSV